MSLDAMIWAMKDAPVADVQERAVLGIMAEAAEHDGTGCWLSLATIAERSTLSEREVRACQQAMVGRGLLALGDQSKAAHVRADRRPKVYDLLIPLSMFTNPARINKDRARTGLPPLTAEDRPDIAPPPPKKRRADLGKKRPPKAVAGAAPAAVDPGPTAGDPVHGVTTSPVVHGGTSSPGGLQVPDGGTTSTSAPYIDPVINPSSSPGRTNQPTPPPAGAGQEEEDPHSATLDDHKATAGDLLAEVQASGGVDPPSQIRSGHRWLDLRRRLAARLAAGWPADAARRRLAGRLTPGCGEGELYAMLRWRIDTLLADPPPEPSTAPSGPHGGWVVPWCGRCWNAARRVALDDDGRATQDPCPTCGLDSMRLTSVA